MPDRTQGRDPATSVGSNIFDLFPPEIADESAALAEQIQGAIYELADQALYRAKHKGRNTVSR
jgi:GGDEF domain-containing protein